MSIDKKKPDTSPADGVNTAADEAPDLDAVMRKYDRESATRLWEGTPQLIIRILMAAFGLFCIGMTLFSKAMPEIRLTMFVGCIIIIGFLTYPASKHHVRVNYLPWYDIVLMVVGAACFFYFALNAMTLVRLSTRIETVHVIIGVVGILILMELCRRCVGLPILCVAGVLIVYAFINQLSYAGAVNGATLYDALKTIIYKLFYTTSGVIGTPINVCYTYIVLFIIFGAFLERTGIANFFISFANRIAGWSSGGPAKVAVISSALCGMVSGSSVGNTVTTGSFTIPMMKKTGYKPEFAGCITVTGLASILINAIVQLAGNATIVGLVLTMLCCIVLGMGVPTTANYCIMASTCAPILIQLGFPLVAAHFFVFYFGIVADITPPVALAAYAGSAIAAFIVPYIFAYSPALLFENISGWWEVAQICVSALLGIFAIAASLNGFLYKKIHPVLRIVLAVGGLGMMIPGTLTDVVGLVLVAAVVAYQKISAKKHGGPVVTA